MTPDDIKDEVTTSPPTVSGGWMSTDCTPGLVSVIIPTFNRQELIVDAVNSVLKQTYRPIELIIVDDGSTDNTSEVIAQWRANLAKNDHFTLIYVQQEKQGANVARNRGLMESHGEYIQFLDSDDVLQLEKIEHAVDVLREQSVDFTYSVVAFCDLLLNPIDGSFGTTAAGTDADFINYDWQTMGPLYRRAVICSVGPWNERIFYADDWEYAARVKLQGWRGVFDTAIGGWLRVYSRADRKGRARREKESRDYFNAYHYIADLAFKLNQLSPAARTRLARRFLVCGIQLGSVGDFARQQNAFLKAGELDPHSRRIRFISKFSAPIQFEWWNQFVLWCVNRFNQLYRKA